MSSVINLLTFHACLLWWKRWGCLAPRIPAFDSEICPGLCTLSSECCSSRLSYSPSCKNKEFIRMGRHCPASLPESKCTQPSGPHPASDTSCSWEAGEELSHSCVWEDVDLLYSYKFCSFSLRWWSCFAWAVLRWTHVGLNTSLSSPEDWQRSRHTCTENWCLLGRGIHVYNWGYEQLGLGLHKLFCLGSPGDSPKKPAVGPSLPSASTAWGPPGLCYRLTWPYTQLLDIFLSWKWPVIFSTAEPLSPLVTLGQFLGPTCTGPKSPKAQQKMWCGGRRLHAGLWAGTEGTCPPGQGASGRGQAETHEWTPVGH